MSDLSGRTALVTGASRGIGRAIALKLARDGARVVVHYSASRAAADAVVDEIRKGGGQADAIAADLAAADGAHTVAAAVRDLGIERLHVLVANAGIAEVASIEDQTVESFDRHFAVNVRAPYFLVQQLLPLLREGSSVVVTSSVVARIAFPGVSTYAGTKGAVDAIVRNLALELGPRGIRVNAVAPGLIETDMANGVIATDEGRQAIIGSQALKRIGQPDEVADVVAFFASDASRWVDGRALEVSGGANL